MPKLNLEANKNSVKQQVGDERAVFGTETQLPGKLGATQAILERLRAEARGQTSVAVAEVNNNSTGIRADKGRATGHGTGNATSMLMHGSAKRSRLEALACENLIKKGRSSKP